MVAVLAPTLRRNRNGAIRRIVRDGQRGRSGPVRAGLTGRAAGGRIDDQATEVAWKLTVTPGTKLLLASLTIAVMVATTELSDGMVGELVCRTHRLLSCGNRKPWCCR